MKDEEKEMNDLGGIYWDFFYYILINVSDCMYLILLIYFVYFYDLQQTQLKKIRQFVFKAASSWLAEAITQFRCTATTEVTEIM